MNENRSKILKICCVYGWNCEDQDGLYQEILFHIWRGLPNLKEEGFANIWLYRVALNASMSFVRKKTSRGADKTTFLNLNLQRKNYDQNNAHRNRAAFARRNRVRARERNQNTCD